MKIIKIFVIIGVVLTAFFVLLSPGRPEMSSLYSPLLSSFLIMMLIVLLTITMLPRLIKELKAGKYIIILMLVFSVGLAFFPVLKLFISALLDVLHAWKK